MNYFKDRYDPRRLAFALLMSTGLRTENAINVRLKDFTEDFKEVRVPECKPHISNKNNTTTIDIKWRWSPIPSWLSLDLKHYIKYRMSLGYYFTGDISAGRLFPCLKKTQLRQLLQKLRKRFGDKYPWLLDVWKIYRYFDKDRNLLSERKWFRISCHGMKAFYCTSAYDICEKDLVATQAVTNHSEIKNLQRYVKTFGVIENKIKLRDRFLEPLECALEIPITKNQKRLDQY